MKTTINTVVAFFLSMAPVAVFFAAFSMATPAQACGAQDDCDYQDCDFTCDIPDDCILIFDPDYGRCVLL